MGKSFGANLGVLKNRFEANGDTLLSLWARANKWPGGRRVFSKMVGRMAPYTATIGAIVETLEPGYARLKMADRKAVRNHLNSVHAIALVNFVEQTTGMAMVSQFPRGTRGIVTHIEVDFKKKARGQLVAECRAPDIDTEGERQYVVETNVMNAEGTVVATGNATWLVGPTKRAATSH